MSSYDLTKPDEVLRWMRSGQYQKGHKQVAEEIAQAMRIVADLRKWATTDQLMEDSPIGLRVDTPGEADGFALAQEEVLDILDGIVKWDGAAWNKKQP